MLTLTENASAAIKNLTDQKAVTADGGLRISTADDSTGSLKVELTPTPEPTDQLVEDAGARVFLGEGGRRARRQGARRATGRRRFRAFRRRRATALTEQQY